jgi:hypothetical protein
MLYRNAIGPILSLVLILLVVSIVFGCSDAGNGDPSKTGEDAWLEFVVASDFDLNQNGYPSASGPAQGRDLRWDFSSTGEYRYHYEQKQINHWNLDDSSDDSRGGDIQILEGAGALIIRSQGDHSARLIVRDLEMRMYMESGNASEDGSEHAVTQTIPPMVIQGMQEDGSLEVCDPSQEALIKTLLPLPPSEVGTGESAVLPARIPMDVMGSRLWVEGNITVMLVGYVDIDGRTCAHLRSIVNISDLVVPEEIEGDYQCSVRGRSESFFSLETRSYVSCEAVMVMAVEMTTPYAGVFSEDSGPGSSTSHETSFLCDNWVRIREAE